jgi:hypothetical protein
MRLDNVFGLLGTILLLQLIDSLDFDFVTAAAFVLLSDTLGDVVVRGPRATLIPKNPLYVLSDAQFKKEFRFSKADIPRLLRCFQWPRYFQLRNGYKFSAEICLLMVLYRFAFPSTLSKLEIMFGRAHTNCSLIVGHGVRLLYARFGARLIDFDVQLLLPRIHLYFQAIARKSAGAVTTCFGLIDGTVHFITRPRIKGRVRRVRNNNNIQRAVYNGHKRHHGIKFQSIVLPDGIVAQMFGPVEGRRHDATLLKLSKIDQKMHLLPPRSFVYGDQAYQVRPWLLSPYRGLNKPHYQRRWNRAMRTVRISVEHGFKIITTLWAHLKFIPAQKIFTTPVARHYVVCTALANMHNCLYPNQVSQHFDLAPPTLEEYCNLYPEV